MAILKSARSMRNGSQHLVAPYNGGGGVVVLTEPTTFAQQQTTTTSNYSKSAHHQRRFHLAHVALCCGVLLAIVSICFGPSNYANCLEQDAVILAPVASLAKAIIRTVTLGVPLEINFDMSGLVKNFAYFTWRTGFPVSMPKGFTQKAQDFYNRIKFRVDEAPVTDVERKSLASLKGDLDDIVDAIVEEVRQSPDGLYTDYLQTRVHGIPIEDACTQVGIQLKAYGVDLTHYRDIAGAVLGIPLMPSVASAVMNVASLANLNTVRNITMNPIGTTRNAAAFMSTLPNSAFQQVSQVSNAAFNSLNSVGQQMVPSFVSAAQAPAVLSMFNSQQPQPL